MRSPERACARLCLSLGVANVKAFTRHADSPAIRHADLFRAEAEGHECIVKELTALRVNDW